MSQVNDKFRSDFAKFVAKAKGNASQVVRKVCIGLSTSVIKKSPVDTGRFRGNWFAGYSMPTEITDRTDISGGGSIEAATATALKLNMGDTFYLVNNLPYAQRLEYGYSTQAPSGMVRISVTEFETFVHNAVQELN